MTRTPLPPSSDLKLGDPSPSTVPVRTDRTDRHPEAPSAQPLSEPTAPVAAAVSGLVTRHEWLDVQWTPDPPEERDPADKTLWRPPVPTFTYLAGAAGCGKTFATREWASRDKGLMLAATTGIAAINLGGTTINSLLGYFDTKSLMESYTNGFLTAKLGKLWKAGVRRIILDEASMLAGDQLTYLVKAIEEVNGRGYVLTDDDAAAGSTDGTGGLGLTLVGDFAQLPPVKAPFAWESTEWDRFDQPGATITLTEIRRQADPAFIEALRQCRRGEGHRALEVFGPGIQRTTDDQFDGPTLLAKNEAVDRYNWIRMNQLQGEAHRDLFYRSQRWGKQRTEWGKPTDPPARWGIPERLHLKVGALVMILANRRMDTGRFLYVNGDLGTVVDGSPDAHTCDVRLHRTGEIVSVVYQRREVLTPMDAARRKQLHAEGKDALIAESGRWEIEGWIDYLPIRVAYASTVHKSQGLSLDQVQVNIADGFFKTPGMLYVALSRARTAGGLRLVGSTAAFVERCVSDPKLGRWL